MQNKGDEEMIKSFIPSINTPSLHNPFAIKLEGIEMSTTGVVVSRASSSSGGGGSRWCPTPEQVMLLEGMYRGGLKTPTATQIQQITARLSLYGKIQGKNVFYWFQNHKARDRQKLRKKLMAIYQHQRLYPPYNPPYHHHPFPLQGGKLNSQSQVGEGGVAEDCKSRVKKWKVDQIECDCPLMTVMMMESTTRVPPKTLQLFPTTTLKDDLISKP